MITVALPVWGERYVKICRERALPSIRAAARGLDVSVLIYTDDPSLWPGERTQWIRLQPSLWWQVLSNAHRDAMARAARGDIVVLWTADMVMSPETLMACQRRLETHMLVACCSMRVCDDVPMPEGLRSREMLAWAWANRHPMVRESTWPDGHSIDMTRLFFEDNGRVTSRQLFPHPLAVKIDRRPLKFFPTVDANLIRNFSPQEIHLVTDQDELAVFELSPPDKDFGWSPERLADRPPKIHNHPIHSEMSRRAITICEER